MSRRTNENHPNKHVNLPGPPSHYCSREPDGEKKEKFSLDPLAKERVSTVYIQWAAVSIADTKIAKSRGNLEFLLCRDNNRVRLCVVTMEVKEADWLCVHQLTGKMVLCFISSTTEYLG
jgi:hypothetical protein